MGPLRTLCATGGGRIGSHANSAVSGGTRAVGTGDGGTHAVVELRDAAIRDGQPGEKDEVDERVDVALLCEVERKRALFVIPGILQIADNIAQQRKRSQDTDFLP